MSEEKKIWYYAQINTDSKLCCGVSQLCGVKIQSDMIEIESYDMSLMGKMWTGVWNEGTQSWDGGDWIGNPNPPEPVEPTTEPTNQDIMNELKAMQGDQVPAATLDAAYREGVNAYV